MISLKRNGLDMKKEMAAPSRFELLSMDPESTMITTTPRGRNGLGVHIVTVFIVYGVFATIEKLHLIPVGD